MEIGVYGLGRFGAFWAEELAKHFDVIAWSRNPERHCAPSVRRVSEDEVLAADVIFLCVDISALEDVLRSIATRLKHGALVMDTCSVKVYPVDLMMRLIPPPVNIMATHPMFGPDSASNGIEGLPLVYWPVRIPSKITKQWYDIFDSTMGLKVLELIPESHDEEAARTQGITHFVGRILGELNLQGSAIATEGYKSLLEIVKQTCNDPWQLFVDLQKYNPYTAQIRTQLYEAISDMLKQFDSIEENNGRDL